MQYVPKNIGSKEKENKQREEMFDNLRKEKLRKKKIIISSLSVIILIIISLVAFAFATPGKYDDFAKCLTEKGAVMYGEDWCQYTQGQKGMFGKSFKYINYHQKQDLKLRPTWVIDGKTYEKVQSFETLSHLTGCKY